MLPLVTAFPQLFHSFSTDFPQAISTFSTGTVAFSTGWDEGIGARPYSGDFESHLALLTPVMNLCKQMGR